jgi:glucokinase
MNQGYPRLLGDIGGTNARWAWQETADAALQDISVLPCQASASLFDSAKNYLAATGHSAPQYAGIGIATPVTGDTVRMTNNSWTFSIQELKQSLDLQRCMVINDFTALAMSLPALGPSDLQSIGTGAAVDGAPIALIGPGTGLGVSGLFLSPDGHYSALSGEGGHVTLAAADDPESALLSLMRSRLDHVSAERVLSGPGLVDLYRAVCELHGHTAQNISPADVTAAAKSGADPDCVNSANYFSSFLGNVSGNLALTLGARGGLYIGGGVVPQLGAAFNASLFRQRFEAKGRFIEYLKTIPTLVIKASTPALIGASRALDLLQLE